MARAAATVLMLAAFLLDGVAAPAAQAESGPLSREQRVWGLMQVWAETKFNFVYFDQVPELDWDQAVQASLPKVLAAGDRGEYYGVLRELVARLDDGHTLILTPEMVTGKNDNPPVELQMIEGKAVLTRVGETDETRRAGLRPGMELVAIGEGKGVPIWAYFEDNVARYFQGGTDRWTRACGLFFMLNGPRGSRVRLHLTDPEGNLSQVELTRDSRQADGSTFIHWMFGQQAPLEHRIIGGSIAYFRVPSFGSEQVVHDFVEAIERLDLRALRGMILDVRVNNGGDSENAYTIISRLIDRDIQTSRWRTRKYLPARRSWGQPEEWFEAEPGTVSPADGSTYHGPLAVLIGPNTVSAAEDFVVPLDYANRAVLIGQATAGTTGNPLRLPLPGGGVFLVCTKRDTYPDGKEFVGLGIEPDLVVRPTQQDVWDDTDRALEKAVELLSTGH